MRYKLPRMAHIFLLFLIAGLTGGFIFYAGCNMGSEYRREVIEAMKANQIHTASIALAQWCAADKKCKMDPVYLATLTTIHLKNGNVDAARYNLDRLMKLLSEK